MKKIILIFLLIVSTHVNAQTNDSLKSGVNFYLITKEKKKHNLPDMGLLSTLIRAKIRQIFDREKLYVLKVNSSEDALEKMAKILHRRHATIENIWFDSHGHYKNHYSSFRVGVDEFSYKNINDEEHTRFLKEIAGYCTENTKIALGACYGAADYYFPATDSTPAYRMNGDSLMIGLGNIFNKSTIYASKSWVMYKPGIFSNKFGLAGYPLNKKFRDSVYLPVWERLGEWRSYSEMNGGFKNVNTVTLNRWGDIRFCNRNYPDLSKAKKAKDKNICLLRNVPGK